MEVTGAFTLEDAVALVQQLDPGGPFQGLPLLVLTQGMESVSSDARGRLARRGEQGGWEPWSAVVATNAIIRVTVNFVARLTRVRRTKLFATEVEALQWLDARVLEDLRAPQ
jgi:hypothetical protein